MKIRIVKRVVATLPLLALSLCLFSYANIARAERTATSQSMEGPAALRGAPPCTDAEPCRDAAGRTIQPARAGQATQTYFLHGFRLGYMYIFNTNTPATEGAYESFAKRYGLRSSNSFVFGYEATWRMVGHDILNVLMIGNVMIAGVEQSRAILSANLLLGFEVAEQLQVGLGASFVPSQDEAAHMIIAAGWTPKVGSFYLPLHGFIIPDVNGHHRAGLTIGVNFT